MIWRGAARRAAGWLGVALLWGPTGAAVAAEGPAGGRTWVAAAFREAEASPPGEGPLTIGDLLRLRDIGGLSVSPDGARVAFQLRQAVLGTDDYELRWFVVPTDGSAPPRALALAGGTPITHYLNGLNHGYAPPDPARWSPDGSKLALRRRLGERIELLQVDLARGDVRTVADGRVQVTAFAWLASGVLVYRTGLDIAALQAAFAQEKRHGWRFDARQSLFAARPIRAPAPDCVTVTAPDVCDLRAFAYEPDGRTRPATPDEVEALEIARSPRLALPAELRAGAGAVARSASGALAWTRLEPGERGEALAPLRRVTAGGPSPRPCPAPDCAGPFITEVGRARADRSVWFLKRVSSQAPARGPLDRVALFDWRPGEARARRLALEGALSDCAAAGTALVCVRSRPTQPDHIVAVDLDTGATRVLADPNPELAGRTFTPIRELTLADPEGNLGFAHLVYPRGYRPGRRYPLVVTLYQSRGFLRGATGDEYPIHPLAAAGVFVLSVDTPKAYDAWRRQSSAEVARYDRGGGPGNRNTVRAIGRALDGLVAEGLVAPDRIAITGLSHGAELVHAALQDSDRFAAAIASQGAIDVTHLAQFGGMRAISTQRDWMAMLGADSLVAHGGLILDTAWSAHPERLRAPLLLNLGQDEALFGFEGIRTLQFAGRPLDVRVFDDEGHVKGRPRNRLGVYENNLAWLAFWLLDRCETGLEPAEAFGRWNAMAADLGRPRRACGAGPAAGAP